MRFLELVRSRLNLGAVKDAAKLAGLYAAQFAITLGMSVLSLLLIGLLYGTFFMVVAGLYMLGGFWQFFALAVGLFLAVKLTKEAWTK